MRLSLINPKKIIWKTIELISEFSGMADGKVLIKTSVAFYIITGMPI